MFTLSFDTLEVPVSSLQASVDFYASAFGLKLEWSDETHALLEPADPGKLGVRLLLVQTEDTRRLAFSHSGNGLDHAVADFKVDNLAAYHAHLREAGIELPDIEPPAHDWAPWGFSFSDPDGNRYGVFSYQGRGSLPDSN